MCGLERKIGKSERKYKKTIENSQICFKAKWVLFVRCIGWCETVSVGRGLNHQCDSVEPLPLRTGLLSLGARVVNPYPPAFPTRQPMCCTQHQCGYTLKENFIMFDSAFLAEVLPRLA